MSSIDYFEFYNVWKYFVQVLSNISLFFLCSLKIKARFYRVFNELYRGRWCVLSLSLFADTTRGNHVTIEQYLTVKFM